MSLIQIAVSGDASGLDDNEPNRAAYDGVFARVPIGLCRRTLDGTFVQANRSMLDLLGVDSLETLHEHRFQPESPPEHQLFLQRLVERGALEGADATWTNVRGEAVYVRLHAALVLDARGEPEGYEATVERVNVREPEELRLRRELDRAREALQAKSQFLANLSHEVRTPLTAIIGFASVLAKEVPPETQRHVALIEKSGRRLVDTMDAVLTYAKIESYGHVLESEAVDLSRVTQEVVQGFELQALSKNLELSVQEDIDAPCIARGDETAIRRTLKVLIGNAIKFTERGSVRVVLRRADEGIAVDVVDTGVGMDAAFVPRAFEAFRQESSGMARSHEGTGIGLTIAQRLAQMMNGRLEVRSEKGIGSTFTLVIPAAAGPEPEDVSERHPSGRR